MQSVKGSEFTFEDFFGHSRAMDNASLYKTLEKLRQDLAKINNVLAETNREINNLKLDNQGKKREIEQLKSDGAERNNEMQILKLELGQKTKQIDKLKKLTAKLDANFKNNRREGKTQAFSSHLV